MKKPDMPILHGQEFGGASVDESTGVQTRWEGKFLFMGDATWAFVFLGPNDEEVWEISGTGTTPRAAFEDCIQVYIALNEGVESYTLKEILPVLREYFNDDGGVKLEHLLALR